MLKTTHKILTLAGMLLVVSLATTAGADSRLFGSAEVSYVDYAAEAEGKEVFSGDTLAQKYSIGWSSSNLYFRTQPRYYTVMLGYDWLSFNTNIDDSGAKTEFNQAFGKFRYNGEIGYNPVEHPIRFKAYANNGETARFHNNLYNGLIDNTLTTSLEGMSKGYVAGVSLVLETERALAPSIRQLPRVYLDYRETATKMMDVTNRLDTKTSELSVAGLNKENNWLQYRNIKYENLRNTADNYERQQILIGLIDNVGRRKWSALTNWINVSTDGSYESTKRSSSNDFMEEYDVNFQAYTTRRNWVARTLMNYNRQVDVDRITDKARIPVYVRGDWNSETDWYVNVSADRGKEVAVSGVSDTSYRNSLAFGGTMFKRSRFNLSPSAALTTSKDFWGKDTYEITAGVDTSSTRAYSSISNLAAGYRVNYRDDGSISNSASWNNVVTGKWQYMSTSPLSFTLREEIEYGKGSGYLNTSILSTKLALPQTNQQYVTTTSSATMKYLFSSAFHTTIDGTHSYVKTGNSPAVSSIQLSHSISYIKNNLTSSLSTHYDKRENESMFSTVGALLYRPNRYHDASVRGSYDTTSFGNSETTNYILTQGYTHNFFKRSGVVRNIASITEELSFIQRTVNGIATVDTKYILVNGRYSPTEKISLYGSLKLQEDLYSLTMFYNAGVSLDFKLLTTTLDYYMAKRDSDDRIERKLSAAVRRSF